MANKMSSPFTVLRFSCWHFSDAGGMAALAVVSWTNLGQGRNTFAGDERDELAHALLHAFLGFFGNLCVFWQCHFHDSRNWSKVPNVSV
jgi:hypothetical protein